MDDRNLALAVLFGMAATAIAFAGGLYWERLNDGTTWLVIVPMFAPFLAMLVYAIGAVIAHD